MPRQWVPWQDYGPRLSVTGQRRRAEQRAARLARQEAGRVLSPVSADDQQLTRTFWGIAWRDNLERYSDLATRLPRGRSYLRSGAVIDLQISAARVTALVSGTELYEVTIDITPIAPGRWEAICRDAAGAIDSLI